MLKKIIFNSRGDGENPLSRKYFKNVIYKVGHILFTDSCWRKKGSAPELCLS